jgi:hypothetical protein
MVLAAVAGGITLRLGLSDPDLSRPGEDWAITPGLGVSVIELMRDSPER